jgi:hypothetical protein
LLAAVLQELVTLPRVRRDRATSDAFPNSFSSMSRTSL